MRAIAVDGKSYVSVEDLEEVLRQSVTPLRAAAILARIEPYVAEAVVREAAGPPADIPADLVRVGPDPRSGIPKRTKKPPKT